MRNIGISLLLICWGYHIQGQTSFQEVQSQVVDQVVRYGDVATFHGPGISFADYDNDGWDDISIPASTTRDFQFLRNTGGQFVVQTLPISSGGLESRQVTWVDFDNDGDLDFFANSDTGVCWLYRNDGNNSFTDIIAASGIAPEPRTYWGNSWGDIDNDGDLDLFLIVRDNDFVDHNLLYRNEGSGIFSDVTESAGLSLNAQFTQSAAFIDYDRDGHQDLFLANDKDELPNVLYRNRGDGTFMDVSIASGMDLHMDGMSATVADYNNDGWLDVYVTNIYPPVFTTSVLGNAFLRNNGDGTFSNIALSNGTRFDGFAWGAVFMDGENDSDLDLHVVSHQDGSEGGPSSAYYQNDGSGIFADTGNFGFENDIAASYGNAIGDIQNDGLPDIAVINIGDQPISIWQNNSTSGNNWLKIKLEGTQSNRMGVGSYIKIGVAGEVQYRYTLCGEGFISQNSLSEFVGIGTANNIEYIEVVWPSGIKDRFENVTPNQMITLVENTNPVENNDQNGGGGTRADEFAHLSVARQWNEALLDAIRNDFARPPVHARNLYHSSLAMYDSWALFDNTAETIFLGKTQNGYSCSFDGIEAPEDVEMAREVMMSYALYRLLVYRFTNSPGATFALQRFEELFIHLGFDSSFTSTDYSSGSYAALGNYLGAKLIDFGYNDGSNEKDDYENEYYQPVNEPLALDRYEETYDLANPNRWQPLAFESFVDQSGNPITGSIPEFLGPEWGQVKPFALNSSDLQILNNGFDSYIYNDPGPPVNIQNSAQEGIQDPYKWHFALVASWSSHLDPSDPTLIDISPGSTGNVDLSLFPANFEEYQTFYDFMEGGDMGTGHIVNPVTGQPYEQQLVKRADYARVLAEFWADGPDSETPPGHWFTILNYVNDHPETIKQIAGMGEVVDDLEWDVKSYLALGGAMHDAAVNTWGIKGYYDYIRPISAIRYMASKGQSTDSSLPSFDPHGLPLIPGRIELIETGDPLAGPGGENVGKIKIYAWKGPDFITDPTADIAGVDWILGTHWWPYQRPTFVTPPFAGYVSGHSTFSRAAAEVLTRLTGDPFFPGGIGVFDIEQNDFLVFEQGPSENFSLQWATYRDASDQTSLSRIWGGIHPPIDDIPGRVLGDKIGNEAYTLADDYFNGRVSIAPNNFLVKTNGESCYDQNDGSITINAQDYYNYILEINGQQYDFTREIVVGDLQPGSYSLCLRVKNYSDFEQCYDVNIQEVSQLNASSKIESVGLSYKATIEVNKGTPPYVLKINDEVKGTYDSNVIITTVENGDLLNVTSALPCEGEYNQHINFNNQILAYPNPTSSTLNIPSSTDKSIIEVYTQSGQLVRAFAGKEKISLASLSKGIYLVVLKNEKNTSSVKVIVLD
ncbi:MAG: T9SS type A sorting domain-containing protein [Flavobacteriaceae bacterium]|nr:VCBS repeat-containing protein [Muriicola sp.]NNL40033.1 T9SS type A sorting domain-containing protein [Flavobacteriaceae bacterium]